MAPKRRRSKVGLGRMDAALDAMRPMGFPSDAVRKSVKKLLKVYGDDGWVFIEDAAYRLLIDTILEEPEGDHLEHESCSKGSHDKQPASGNELCDEEATYDEHGEPPCAQEIHGSGQDVELGQEKMEGQDSGFEATPMPFQDVKDHEEMGVEVGFGPAYNTQPVKRRRPCYGWISDDEGDEIVEATPSGNSLTDGLAA